jgi:voltage-gated potassium channel
MGVNPSIWSLLQEMLGMRGGNNMDIRPLTEEEKRLTWGDLFPRFRADGLLPLGLAQADRQLSLEDVLDQGSALDQFILELFQSSGQETRLGNAGPRVLANPPDSEPLSGFDAVLYLRQGEKR